MWPTDKDIARDSILEARMARRGEGHWSTLPEGVRLANARSYLATAAEYRTRAAASLRWLS